jgi:hypothetical protein
MSDPFMFADGEVVDVATYDAAKIEASEPADNDMENIETPLEMDKSCSCMAIAIVVVIVIAVIYIIFCTINNPVQKSTDFQDIKSNFNNEFPLSTQYPFKSKDDSLEIDKLEASKYPEALYVDCVYFGKDYSLINMTEHPIKEIILITTDGNVIVNTDTASTVNAVKSSIQSARLNLQFTAPSTYRVRDIVIKSEPEIATFDKLSGFKISLRDSTGKISWEATRFLEAKSVNILPTIETREI